MIGAMRAARGVKPGVDNDFEVENNDSLTTQFESFSKYLSYAGFGISAIALLAASIGIMNIMLVSVSERTREIGLRKAVGATPTAILLQFLLEAVTLCLAGGVVGVLIGQAFAFGVSQIPGARMENASVPFWAVVLAFALFLAFFGAVLLWVIPNLVQQTQNVIAWVGDEGPMKLQGAIDAFLDGNRDRTSRADGKKLTLSACIASATGDRVMRAQLEGSVGDPEALGREVAAQFLRDGARAIIQRAVNIAVHGEAPIDPAVRNSGEVARSASSWLTR